MCAAVEGLLFNMHNGERFGLFNRFNKSGIADKLVGFEIPEALLFTLGGL